MSNLTLILGKKSIQTLLVWGMVGICLSLQLAVYWRDYSRPFRKDFMYNLYYHSQWVVPEHIQSIGDDGLYQVAGDQLIKKHNFYEINPEVPPLGKYYYGLSIKLFGNAEFGALLLFISSGVLYFLLTKKFIKDPVLQGFAVLFFVTDPLLFYQSRISMLDLPQLVALLVHVLSILFLIMMKKNELNIPALVVAGLSLGAFMSIKIGALGLVIILADIIILFKHKSTSRMFPILTVAGLTYLLTYTMYFVQGHSLVEWLKAQKWMVHFYLASTIKPVFGTVLTTLLFGRIIGWDQGATWVKVSEWTISWSVFFLAYLMHVGASVKKILTMKHEILYVLLLITGLLAGYILLPFFTRYLVLLIPILIVVFIRSLEKLEINSTYITFPLVILFCIHYYLFWL